MNIISQYLNFSDYNHTILCPAAALGFLVSYALVSSPTTPTSIPTSKLLSAMSTLTLSTLWWIFFRQGCYIYIGAEKRDLCPMRPLTEHLHVRGSTSGPHFLLSEAPLSIDNGWHLVFNKILSAAGVPGCYIGHNFCIGIAISAASGGLPDHLIKTFSKWSSDAYQIYIHNLISTFVGVASLLTWQVFPAYLSPFLVISVGCFGTLVVQGQGLQLRARSLWGTVYKVKVFWKIVYLVFVYLCGENCRQTAERVVWFISYKDGSLIIYIFSHS